jgi:DNA invertase Pin-like site-specific DNA recombinase
MVAAYYRISRARDDMHAPEIYEEEIRRYCHYRRLDLAEIFSDIDYSGWRDSRPRPSLNRLLERRKEFSLVVVPKLSRLGRSLSHLCELFDQFDSDGVGLIFLDVGIDTSTSQGRLLRNILSCFAEYESDLRSDFSRAAHRHLAEQGVPNGHGPTGYVRDGHTFVIDEPAASVVRLCYDLFQGGLTFRQIARELGDRGFSKPSGASWDRISVRSMLDNPAYAGWRSHRGSLYRGNWKPIINPGTWQRVQALRRLARPSPGTNTAAVETSVYLLSGMLYCGVCGRKLHHRTKQDRVPGVYVCRGDPKVGRCDGGGIADHRAEAMAVNAFLSRYRHALDRGRSTVGDSSKLGTSWDDLSLEEKRELLKTAVERIELLPRPQGNLRGRGQPRGKRLAITWTGTASGADPEIPSSLAIHRSVGKTCVDCGRRKPLREFRRDESSSDGRSDRCGRCHTLRQVNSLIEGPAAIHEDSHPSDPDPRAPWHEYQRALALKRCMQ